MRADAAANSRKSIMSSSAVKFERLLCFFEVALSPSVDGFVLKFLTSLEIGWKYREWRSRTMNGEGIHIVIDCMVIPGRSRWWLRYQCSMIICRWGYIFCWRQSTMKWTRWWEQCHFTKGKDFITIPGTFCHNVSDNICKICSSSWGNYLKKCSWGSQIGCMKTWISNFDMPLLEENRSSGINTHKFNYLAIIRDSSPAVIRVFMVELMNFTFEKRRIEVRWLVYPYFGLKKFCSS